eukprot:767644-Hanusia_phi.AAC.1
METRTKKIESKAAGQGELVVAGDSCAGAGEGLVVAGDCWSRSRLTQLLEQLPQVPVVKPS